MPLVNLLNRIDVTAVIHQDSLVFFLDRVFQAIERQPEEKVQMKSLTTLTTSSSQLPHKTEMTVLLLLFIKLSISVFISYTVLLKNLPFKLPN